VAAAAGGSGAAATHGDATWLHRFFDTDLWTTSGGDYATASSASTAVQSNGTYQWGNTAAMVADVRAWLANPATNFGWIVIGDENVPVTTKRFDSRENTNAAQRPSLTVYFTRP
jgi:hypothetical protein